MLRRAARALVVAAVFTFGSTASAGEEPGLGVDIDLGVRELVGCGHSYVIAVAFRTPLDGHVIDGCGHVFRTQDGGEGWVEDEALELAVYGVRPGLRDSVAPGLGAARIIHWWSQDDGLVGVTRGAFFVTSDGGATWTRVPTSLPTRFDAAAVSGDALLVCDDRRMLRGDARGRRWTEVSWPFDRPEDRCVTLEGSPDGGVTAVSLSGRRWVTEDAGDTWAHRLGPPPKYPGKEPGCPGRRGDEVVRCEGSGLVFERPGQAPRRTSLVSPRSGRTVPLLGKARGRWGWIGWTEGHLVASEDGASWKVRAELPAKVARLTVLATDDLILEAHDGRVFRGNLRAEWSPSPAPAFDRADAEQQRTGTPKPSPLACVAGARVARVKVDKETAQCWAGIERHRVLTVELGPRGAELTFVREGSRNTVRVDRARALELVDALSRAIAPPERPVSCVSTSSYTMFLSWSCDGVAGGPLDFWTNAFYEPSWTCEGYSRAYELFDVIWKAGERAR